MSNKTHFFLLIFLAMGLGTAQAESIWSRRTQEHSFLFYDTRARDIGDLVTILISQSTDVDSREDREMNKSTQASSVFDLEAESGGGFGNQAANAALDFGATSNREFEGENNFRSAQGFTDRVTATVIQVLPNGNLMISGKRDVQVAGEARSLIVSGVIRPIDLSPQNTVNSRYIADFQLTYEGVGPAQTFTKQGWLGKRINRWWPF